MAASRYFVWVMSYYSPPEPVTPLWRRQSKRYDIWHISGTRNFAAAEAARAAAEARGAWAERALMSWLRRWAGWQMDSRPDGRRRAPWGHKLLLQGRWWGAGDQRCADDQRVNASSCDLTVEPSEGEGVWLRVELVGMQ